jgi:hypothetical protein
MAVYTVAFGVQGSSWGALPGADRDAFVFSGFSGDPNAAVVTGRAATIGAFSAAVAHAHAAMAPADTLALYVSTHGVDFGPVFGAALGFADKRLFERELEDVLEDLGADRRVVLVLDACYSVSLLPASTIRVTKSGTIVGSKATIVVPPAGAVPERYVAAPTDFGGGAGVRREQRLAALGPPLNADPAVVAPELPTALLAITAVGPTLQAVNAEGLRYGVLTQAVIEAAAGAASVAALAAALPSKLPAACTFAIHANDDARLQEPLF